MALNSFNLYTISAIATMVSFFALLFHLGNKKLNPIFVGLLLGIATSSMSIMASAAIFTYTFLYANILFMIAVLVSAILCMTATISLDEKLTARALGNPAPLPHRGVFTARSENFAKNGKNLVWLEKPPFDTEVEKVYEIPRGTQISTGQTVSIEDGKITLI